tara:strand:- start:4655 stop:5254 length:600 start_codon:yes stop_codon:yes gene_type:complete
MDKKFYIQMSIIFGIVIIIAIIYINYFKNPSVSNVDNDRNDEKLKIIEGSSDLIKQMSYFSEDSKGNRYEINSESGIINSDKSNLIFMNKVTAVIFLLNGEKILISSNEAKYNDENNDTTFSGYVKMIYSDHKIVAENLDLSFKDQTAVLYDNVNYKSNLTNVSADRIFIDFISKNIKIKMDDEKNNILVQSKIKNVGN